MNFKHKKFRQENNQQIYKKEILSNCDNSCNKGMGDVTSLIKENAKLRTLLREGTIRSHYLSQRYLHMKYKKDQIEARLKLLEKEHRQMIADMMDRLKEVKNEINVIVNSQFNGLIHNNTCLQNVQQKSLLTSDLHLETQELKHKPKIFRRHKRNTGDKVYVPRNLKEIDGNTIDSNSEMFEMGKKPTSFQNSKVLRRYRCRRHKLSHETALKTPIPKHSCNLYKELVTQDAMSADLVKCQQQMSTEVVSQENKHRCEQQMSTEVVSQENKQDLTHFPKSILTETNYEQILPAIQTKCAEIVPVVQTKYAEIIPFWQTHCARTIPVVQRKYEYIIPMVHTQSAPDIVQRFQFTRAKDIKESVSHISVRDMYTNT